MRSFWSDPYLWIHLAGIAAVPLFLELCLVGLAAGDPILPLGLEGLLVAIAGIAPILWMQWQRPFSIFSLVLLAIKPSELSDDQRRLLRLFKGLAGQVVAVAIAALMAGLLWKIYGLAPIATGIAEIVPGGRVGGLALAAIAFLLANLFIQVPASVVRVLLVSDAAFAAVAPYPVEKIAADFVLLGIGVEEIVPPLVFEPKAFEPKAFAPKRQKPQPIPTSSTFVDELFANEDVGDEQVGDSDETSPELENQTEPEIQVESAVQLESEISAEPEIPAEPEIQVESETLAEPEIQVEAEISAEPEIPAEPEIQAESEIPAEPAAIPTELAEAELSAEPQVQPEEIQLDIQPEEIQPDIQPEEIQSDTQLDIQPGGIQSDTQPDIQPGGIQSDIQPEASLAADLEPAPEEAPAEEVSEERDLGPIGNPNDREFLGTATDNLP